MVVNIKIMLFWDVLTYSLVDKYQCLGGTC
jgi:hypothetical protein